MLDVSIKKRVLFVVLPYLLQRGEAKLNTKIRSFKAFPYGLLSVITYTKNHIDHLVEIELFDCNFSEESPLDYLELLHKKLEEFCPDIVGLSMMFDNSYQYVEEICETIDLYNKNIIIVMGGNAAFSSYKDIIEEQQHIDAICYAEGEMPFVRLIESAEPRALLDADPSWITKKSLATQQAPQKSYVMNLDEMIDIDYSYVNAAAYAMQEGFSPYANATEKKKQFFITASRGCPFKCTFCWKSADDDKSMRYASIEKISDHVQRLIDNFGLNVLTIYDDQLLFNRKWSKALFRALAKFNIRVECPNGLTVAYIDDEMAEVMCMAGVDTVNLAIESGSPYVLNTLMKKPLRVEQIGPAVQRLRKHNFWIHGFMVSGMPGEIDAHRDETVRVIKHVGLDWAGFSLAIPSRGSKLWQECIEKGFIDPNLPIGALEPNKYMIANGQYTSEYVARKTYLMNLEVNFVHNYRFSNGEYAIAAKAFLDVTRRYENHAFAYYFLAKAKAALQQDTSQEQQFVRAAMAKDPAWAEYFAYFDIDPHVC